MERRDLSPRARKENNRDSSYTEVVRILIRSKSILMIPCQ